VRQGVDREHDVHVLSPGLDVQVHGRAARGGGGPRRDHALDGEGVDLDQRVQAGQDPSQAAQVEPTPGTSGPDEEVLEVHQDDEAPERGREAVQVAAGAAAVTAGLVVSEHSDLLSR